LASTITRTLYYDAAYGPFGEPYAQSGTTDLSFTGQNQDTASNLYDFPAREYGTQGRWPSPDPAGIVSVHLRDPQTWNRYAYVRNNPLRLVDATGLDSSVQDDDGGGGDAGGGDPVGDPVIASAIDPLPCTPGVICGSSTGNTGNSSSAPPADPWCSALPGGCEGDSGNSGNCYYMLLDPCGGSGGSARPSASKPKCSAAQQAAARLAAALQNTSDTTKWIGVGFGMGTILAGAGEGVSLGIDTPVTITFGSATTFFGTASFLTGAAASMANAFASGNATALLNFNWSNLVNVASTAAASKIPGIGHWAETIGNLAEQGADLAMTGTDACQ
jgi:RHS repeat-associated protein